MLPTRRNNQIHARVPKGPTIEAGDRRAAVEQMSARMNAVLFFVVFAPVASYLCAVEAGMNYLCAVETSNLCTVEVDRWPWSSTGRSRLYVMFGIPGMLALGLVIGAKTFEVSRILLLSAAAMSAAIYIQLTRLPPPFPTGAAAMVAGIATLAAWRHGRRD